MTKPLLSRDTKGLLLAFVGVMIFSATLPATRIAVRDFDPIWVALARVEIAAVAAAGLLLFYRIPIPGREHYRALMLTAIGVVLGFPILTSIAMKTSTASHGAVIVAILPIMTALVAALRNGERPSRAFWIASMAGTCLVVIYAWLRGGTQHGVTAAAASGGSWAATLGASLGGFTLGDLAMLGAVLLAALGYAEGGKLAKVLGGWQTIAWTLVFSAPVLLLPMFWFAGDSWRTASVPAWGALFYLAMFSQFIGFFFWYGGMAIGGVARASQAQLTQLFGTLFISIWLLGEQVDAMTWLIAAAVMLAVVATRRAPILRAAVA